MTPARKQQQQQKHAKGSKHVPTISIITHFYKNTINTTVHNNIKTTGI